MNDNGGTSHGGVNACTNRFALGVYWINQPPHLRGATNVVVLENAAPTNVVLTVYDVDSAGSNLTLTAVCANTKLIRFTPIRTNWVSGSNATDFTFQVLPQTNANGKTTVALTATDGVNTITNQVSLKVTAVDQPPSFVFSTNWLQVCENAGQLSFTNFLTAVSPGPTNELTQTLTFSVGLGTNASGSMQFASKPALKLAGTNANLSFRTATNSFGTNTIVVVLKDSGTTANGGVNSFSNSFVLAVPWIKYTPVLYGLKDITLLENKTNLLNVPFTVWDPTFTNFSLTADSSDSNVMAVSLSAAAGDQHVWLEHRDHRAGERRLRQQQQQPGDL